MFGLRLGGKYIFIFTFHSFALPNTSLPFTCGPPFAALLFAPWAADIQHRRIGADGLDDVPTWLYSSGSWFFPGTVGETVASAKVAR